MNHQLSPTIHDLTSLAEASLAAKGEHTALVFEDAPHTNAAILERSRALQSGLQALGVKSDDIVLVCMHNDPVVHSVFMAGFRCGAVLTPVMAQLAVPELEFIMNHTEARGVVTDADRVDTIREAAKRSGHIKWILVCGGETNESRSPREIRLESLLELDAADDWHTRSRDDVALMLYTSGTTGRPKGVMLTHGNLLANAETLVDAAEPELRDHPVRMLTPLPMAHIFGISLMTVDFMMPAEFTPSVLVQERRFDATRILELIQGQRCTDLSVVPTMVSVLLNHPDFDSYDLSSLFKVDVGGAPMAVELAERWREQVGSHVRQRYGMTENTGKGSTDRTSEPYHPGSVGRPYHTVEIRIVDEFGNDVPCGERGEILTSGPTTMKGYYKDSEATSTAIVNGWLHTGDIGYLSEDGWLYVVDRRKDMIIKGGENIYPAELEDILYRHEDIIDAAVVGMPHESWGEEPVAFVVLREPDVISPDAIIAYVGTQIAPFKAPGIVRVIDELPKSGVGKVLRRELRDRMLGEAGHHEST